MDSEDIRRIDQKLDHVIEKLGSQAAVLERNTVSLDYHIRRTDLLEERVERQDEKLDEALIPIRFLRSINWLASLGAGVATILLTYLTYLAMK